MKALKHISILLLALFITSCVQKTYKKTIHFKLDMNGIKNPLDVGIKGDTNPLSWDEALSLTDNNNDGIYKASIELESASYDIEFKFVNQQNNFELKDADNRSIRFEYKPETIVYEATFNNPEAKTTKTN